MFYDIYTLLSTLVLSVFILTRSVYCTNLPNIFIPYAWRTVDFLYPNEIERNNAIKNGSFVPTNVIINDVDVWNDSIKGYATGGKRIFISTPRIRPGIPATLSTVSDVKNQNDSFLLSPFPDWPTQAISGECIERIVSVDKMHIDRCGLLWVIDTGRIDEFIAPRRICQPKIVIYDLQDNDHLIERYEVPDGVVNDRSSLTTTVTDAKSANCRDAIAFIADLNGNGLVIFDLNRRLSWRIDHNYFYPYPRYGTFNIAGVVFDLMDGIFGMALGPTLKTGDRTLYFHSLASVRESWVPTSVLQNRSLLAQREQLRYSFSVSPEFREGQSSLEVMTENGILIYNVLPRNALACWNTAVEPVQLNTEIIYESFEHLQFVSGMKLKGDTLWIATNRVQNAFSNNSVATTNNSYANNFSMRIICIRSVKELLKKSKCLRAL